MLELDGVSKTYETPGENILAVDRATLTVAPSEFLTILGPSGAGKTTLLLLMAGIIHPDAGAVRFAGLDLAALAEPEAANYRLKTVGFVFQLPNLLPMTAIENVALPLIGGGSPVRAAIHDSEPLLERVGLSHRVSHYPHELSGGERQRVAIARALVRRPQVVLADEPTGSLDSRRGAEVLGLLRETCIEQAAAAVVVTHDVRASTYADRTFTIEDGRLVQAGVREPGLSGAAVVD